MTYQNLSLGMCWKLFWATLRLIRRISSSNFLWNTFLKKKKKRMEILRRVKKGNEAGYIVRQHYALKMHNSCIIRCFYSGRDADISVIGFKLSAISQVSVIYFCSRFYCSQISVFNEKKKRVIAQPTIWNCFYRCGGHFEFIVSNGYYGMFWSKYDSYLKQWNAEWPPYRYKKV